MDISAPLRISYLRQSTYYLNPTFQNVVAPTSPIYNYDDKLKPLKLTRKFTKIMYEEYKSECDDAREKVDRIASFKYFVPRPYSGFFNRIWRILTIFPVRDMGWVAAVVFIFANGMLLLGNFFTVVPLVSESVMRTLPGVTKLGIPITLGIGLVLFDVAVALGFVVAFNVDRGKIDGVEDVEKGYEIFEVGKKNTYLPALIGSEEFVWFPSLLEFKTKYLPRPAFQAGLIQGLGTIFYTISNISQEPAILDHLSSIWKMILVSLPILLGSICFLTTSIILMQVTQDKWWKPRWRDTNFYALLFGSLGAVGLITTAMLQFFMPESTLLIAGFAMGGRAGFWFGNLGRLAVLMEFYPN